MQYISTYLWVICNSNLIAKILLLEIPFRKKKYSIRILFEFEFHEGKEREKNPLSNQNIWFNQDLNWATWSTSLSVFSIFIHSTVKVIYTKYSKHWPYTVAHTIDYVCSEINNSWFNPLFSFYFSSLYPAPYTKWCIC